MCEYIGSKIQSINLPKGGSKLNELGFSHTFATQKSCVSLAALIWKKEHMRWQKCIYMLLVLSWRKARECNSHFFIWKKHKKQMRHGAK